MGHRGDLGAPSGPRVALGGDFGAFWVPLGGHLGTKISMLRYFFGVVFKAFTQRVLGSTFYRKMWPQGSVQEGGM